VIAHLDAGDALADGLDDAAALMAQDAGEDPFRIFAGQGEGIGVADAGSDDPHPHFTGFGRFDIDFNDLQRLVGGKGNGGAGFDRHGIALGRVTMGISIISA
jgi:hypothetical protein